MTDSNAAAVSVSGSDIPGTFKALRTALMRYYDTPFGVDDRSVMEERRLLLDVDGERGVSPCSSSGRSTNPAECPSPSHSAPRRPTPRRLSSLSSRCPLV